MAHESSAKTSGSLLGHLLPRKVPPEEEPARGDRPGNSGRLPRRTWRSHDLHEGRLMNLDTRTCHDLPGRGACSSYHPGHDLHFIHNNHLGETPWGWRDGVITAVVDGLATVDYVIDEGGAVVWHHHDLADIAPPGTLVRVHERLHALGGPFGWLNVELVSGVGPVPTPEDPSAWAAEMRVGVTDLGTGRGVAVDHVEPG